MKEDIDNGANRESGNREYFRHHRTTASARTKLIAFPSLLHWVVTAQILPLFSYFDIATMTKGNVMTSLIKGNVDKTALSG